MVWVFLEKRTQIHEIFRRIETKPYPLVLFSHERLLLKDPRIVGKIAHEYSEFAGNQALAERMGQKRDI